MPGRAPSLVGVGAQAPDFYLSTGRMPLPTRGPTRAHQAGLHAAARSTPSIAYIASLGGSADPDGRRALGDLSEGERAFALDCAGCHQIVARGGIVTGQRRSGAPAGDRHRDRRGGPDRALT